MGSFGAESLRIGELSDRLGITIKVLRRMADADAIPYARSSGGHRLFDPAAVRATLAAAIPAVAIVPERPPDWSASLPLAGLDEAEVWKAAAGTLQLDPTTSGTRIAAYAFTEMLNNAIDHSGGSTAVVGVWSGESEVAFRISDDGEGVFAHLQQGLDLAHPLDAAGELTKGKRTTWRERHTGEGIFFTSKAVGVFRISANGFRMTVDNPRSDVGLGVSPVGVGSVIEASIPLPPPRELRAVFEEFTNDDQQFSRTRPTVKLFGSGVMFVSRSEARRVMEGMSAFEEIDIDFAGVDDVGQGFVDEILRVWPAQNPSITVTPINMNEAVRYMIRRGRPAADSSG